MVEEPIQFYSKNNLLLGILHHSSSNQRTRIGIIVVVGGPQYRVGSHRQFLLLARSMARKGIPVFRFDYRGMGDSEGETASFENIDIDIKSAIDAMFDGCSNLKKIILWGLCDAASAISFYAYKDPRIHGVVLLNPWIHTETGQAETYLKHYYWYRLIDKDFWAKIASGKYNFIKSIRSFTKDVILTVRNRAQHLGIKKKLLDRENSLPERMLYGLLKFAKPTLIILSENDFTANEFRDNLEKDKAWGKWMNKTFVRCKNIADADHTFSSAIWRAEVVEATYDWLIKLV